ncbi:MAG: hypothetical protein NZS48_17365, partial [Gemmata sp.]|nr:hypothetical protein [Gemmata sp.]
CFQTAWKLRKALHCPAFFGFSHGHEAESCVVGPIIEPIWLIWANPDPRAWLNGKTSAAAEKNAGDVSFCLAETCSEGAA